MQEYIDILKECGVVRRKAEKMAVDLKNSLKKRGMEVKVEEEEKPKKKKTVKDIFEIDNTYLKEDDK